MKYRLLYAFALAAAVPMAASAAISVSIDIAPPPLPVYVQPPIPAPNYLWTPGYWRWDPSGADYFWVPGTWVAPPSVGLLWTPGYWGWGGGGYAWHGGYWGPHVGFYGGVNYGYGYVGSGYRGGRWEGDHFSYNRSVNNINTTIVHNVYNERIVENNNTRVSFNGGQGGTGARPTPQERAWQHEQHVSPTSMQRQHEQVAMRTPEQHASFNHGAPTMAATPRPAALQHGERGAPPMQGGDHRQAQAMQGGDHRQAQAMPAPRQGGEMHGAPGGQPHAEPPYGGGQPHAEPPHGGGQPHAEPPHAGGEPHGGGQPHGEPHGGGNGHERER